MTHPDLKLVAGPTAESASIAEFADAMSELASGVVLVTCRVGDRPWGMTVTAVASVSVAPPTILVSLDSTTASARAITATRRFGVSILAAEQYAVARHGSVPGATKFIETFADGEHSATPAVTGALAHLDCELSEAVQVADHTVFFGLVTAARRSSAGTALLYHRRAYRILHEPATGRNVRCLSS